MVQVTPKPCHIIFIHILKKLKDHLYHLFWLFCVLEPQLTSPFPKQLSLPLATHNMTTFFISLLSVYIFIVFLEEALTRVSDCHPQNLIYIYIYFFLVNYKSTQSSGKLKDPASFSEVPSIDCLVVRGVCSHYLYDFSLKKKNNIILSWSTLLRDGNLGPTEGLCSRQGHLNYTEQSCDNEYQKIRKGSIQLMLKGEIPQDICKPLVESSGRIDR